MPGPPSVRRALVVEPEERRAVELAEAIRRLDVTVEIEAEAEEAWRRFVAFKPEVLFLARAAPSRGGDWFLRRLQNEYMGQMPATYLLCEPAEIDLGLVLEPDAVILPPLSRRALAAIVGDPGDLGDTASRQATRLRELFELSLLGGDLLGALDNMVARAALAFQVSDCVLWGNPNEPHWPRTARLTPEGARRQRLLDRCRLAARAGVTLLVSEGEPGQGMVVDAPGMSLLAASLGQALRADVGALCLVSDESRRFYPDERDVLRVVARRTSAELAWVSAHHRLVAEHERLRETALLDPLLGVLTRSGFEQAVESEIVSARRNMQELALVVLDFVQLKGVNDRYGHVVGDAVLSHFARTVQQHLRSSDLVGRFGGDELAILLADTDLEGAERVLEHLLGVFEESPLTFEGKLEIKLRATAGLTPILAEDTDAESALARALGAMRLARKQGLPLGVRDPRRDVPSEDSQVFDLAGEGLPAGSTLGGMYRILHEISRGSMGVVYRAQDLGLGRPVALKVLRSDLASDRGLVTRFRAEASMLASLHHNNLVQVFSFGQEGDDVFFVMELVEGEPLSEVIHRLDDLGDQIGADVVVKVVDEIAEALDAIHSVGIIHRDVKPANVVLDRIHDRAVLVDVGVAKRREDVGDAAGTPGFAAPESFMDAKETPETDVYGLAATAYTMLTGVPPYGGGELLAVVNRQLFDKPAPPSALRPGLTHAVDEVIYRALDPEQKKRYQSAGAFAIAMSRALERRSAAAETARSELPSGAPAPARRKKRGSLPPPDPAIGTLELTLTGAQVLAPDAGEPHARGALLRVAHKLLGHRLGSSWLQEVAASDSRLAEALAPTLSPMSWQPLSIVVQLLRAASDDPTELARALGRSTVSATFTRFFGADPTTMAPQALLRAAEGYWTRFHNWGRIAVQDEGEGGVLVELHDGVDEPVVCALVEGILGRIAESAGARAVVTRHPTCSARGDGDVCRFAVEWASVS